MIIDKYLQKKEFVENFFQNLTTKELDEMLERNGINDKESVEAFAYRKVKEEIEKGEL